MTDLVTRLRSVLDDSAVVDDSDVLATHRNDHATFCAAGVPAVLVRPSTTSEVAEVLKVAGALGVPVVPQGARTGLSGAANAIDGCILLSTARMNRILEISAEDQVAVVQPGVVNAELSRAVLDQGLFYPPDPSSWEMSTIGGNIATNAGGLCCVKYGVTVDFVRGLEVVLASGEVVRTGRRSAKGVAGYDLTRLIVGSEGTLGVVTEATLTLRPAPEAALTAAATFLSIEDGIAAAAAIMASGLRPSLLEFLDGPTARAIQDYRDMGLPASVGSLLIAQSDRGPRAADDVAQIAAICTAHGAVEVAEASDAEESRMLLEARRLVNPALEPLGVTLVDDVAVPRSRLVELLRGIGEIAAKYQVLICCPGHVGDGNMHPTVIFERDNPAAQEKALEAFGAVMELGLALGGTITGEHGIGLLKARWLEDELGPIGLDLHRRVKAAFDPHGLLNPGKVLR
ncbi:FAD-binding protein [Kribbella sandramycini]|uniref:FAD-binding protein n=1 Tax=Kribbella sandramycini TaxID=60450 RepID=A0A7Y4NZ93_9ACTN|nr:FAD-linked oxidase C-terminal domain-containing protein [Kribbella sandramycini]MBB6565090.1 glycolate oxidase [Kribbella sandramycini]NOL41361.1 FAD-binding protein [Kribbella sandramycini]